MTRATKGFSVVVCGVLLILAGLFGWFGEVSFLFVGAGLLGFVVGAGWLLSAQSRTDLRAPHPVIYGLLALAIIVHVFQNLRMMSAGFSYGWFIWALLPYGLVLVLSCFQGTRVSVIAGAALALAADAWNYFEVARSTSSTAALNFIWIPIWNTIIVVPVATFLAWLWLRRRHQVSANAP